jgi:hypothetical protein
MKVRCKKPAHLRSHLVDDAFGGTHGQGIAVARVRVSAVLHHGQKCSGAFGDAIDVFVDQPEEVALARHQLGKNYADSNVVCRLGRVNTI